VCGIERPSKLVYIYHTLLVQTEGRRGRSQRRRNREEAVMEALNPVLLFVIFHKHKWLNLYLRLGVKPSIFIMYS
jgi:hypothetical protein